MVATQFDKQVVIEGLLVLVHEGRMKRLGKSVAAVWFESEHSLV